MTPMFLNQNQAMEFLGVSRTIFRNMRLSGKLKSHKWSRLPSARCYYKVEELKNLKGWQ